MRLPFLILCTGLFTACSHSPKTERTPAAAVIQDSDQEVTLLYYQEGRSILIKSCQQELSLELPLKQIRAQCRGKSVKIPLEEFEFSLHEFILKKGTLAPFLLTKDEERFFREKRLGDEDLETLALELNQLNTRLSLRAATRAELILKDELTAKFTLLEKVSREVEAILEKVGQPVELIVPDSPLNENEFLRLGLLEFAYSLKGTCGLGGSREKRIRDCASHPDFKNPGLSLVTRSSSQEEIHLDPRTKLLWTSALPRELNYQEALKACQGLKKFAGMSGLTWRLPSMNDYEALKSSITPGQLGEHFWSSTQVDGESTHSAKVYASSIKTGDVAEQSDSHLVRCVGR